MKRFARSLVALSLLAGSAPVAVSFAAAPESASAAVPSTAKTAAAITAAAEKFLAPLDAATLAKVTMRFDDPARLDWHNIPKDTRKGLQYKDMTEDQRKACKEIIKASLSDEGYKTAERIMSLETNLLIGEKGKGPFRDPERYFLTIFGKPAMTGSWGYSFEGHHYSLNFVIRDGVVVSDTPSFMGANPATVGVFVPGGPEVGTRTLADEEQLAFDLVGSLDEGQLKTALIAKEPPKDYRNAGVPTPPQGAPEGIAAADLNETQKKTLWSLLEAYCANLAPELGAVRLADLQAAGKDRIYFAWAGSTKPGVGHYYRVQGPTFVLELVNIQSDPQGNPANHIHSVWRNLKGDFGVATK
jgi:hypothetical protein